MSLLEGVAWTGAVDNEVVRGDLLVLKEGGLSLTCNYQNANANKSLRHQ